MVGSGNCFPEPLMPQGLRIEYVAGMSEQRGLLETQVDISGRKLRVYVTHLSHSSKEQRLLQVEQVRRSWEAL